MPSVILCAIVFTDERDCINLIWLCIDAFIQWMKGHMSVNNFNF